MSYITFLVRPSDHDHFEMALSGLPVKALSHLTPFFTQCLFTEWLTIARQHLYDSGTKGAKKKCTTEVHLGSIFKNYVPISQETQKPSIIQANR